MSARLGLSLLLALVTVAGPAQGEEPPAPAPALSLHDEAKELYAAGRYHEAVEKLEQAVEIDPDAKLLHYNLGLLEEKLGRLDRAIGHYRRCLELETDPDERAHLEEVVARLEGARQHGLHTPPVAEAPPEAPPPSNPPTSTWPSPWAIALGSLSLTAGVSAIVLGVHAASVDPGDEAATNHEVGVADLQEDAAEAHHLGIATDVLGAVAVGAAVAAAVVVLAPRDDTAVALGPGGGVVRWRF